MTKENNIDLGSGDPASGSAEATVRPREAGSAEEAQVCDQMRKLGTLPSKQTMQSFTWESQEMSITWSPVHHDLFFSMNIFLAPEKGIGPRKL